MTPHTPAPAVPLTLEGASVLHQMYRIKWGAWHETEEFHRHKILAEAMPALEVMERPASGESALFSILGHKGDLMLVHFRPSFDELKQAELALQQLEFIEYLEPTTSYVSVVELGVYKATVAFHRQMAEKGIRPGTTAWEQAESEMLANQRRAMQPRLFPKIPPRRYLCFYPMDKKRGEEKNWYMVPMEERARMMEEHGLIGRKYADVVKQIISGSIGFDDWEWGVDLFADDPVVFKKLIYEMRFDEASAVYALFGPFYAGLRFAAKDLPDLMSGRTPEWTAPAGAAE